MTIPTISEPAFSLRRATPAEFPEIVRIDDAASTLFAQEGIYFDLDENHPFVKGEYGRWAAAIVAGLACVAVDANNELVGFMTLGIVDDAPYLDQLSVHPRAMRRGIGTALISHALEWSGSRPLWLDTYSHVSWNAPYYRRFGFVLVPEAECGPEMKAILESQRAALPYPECRVAMVRRRG